MSGLLWFALSVAQYDPRLQVKRAVMSQVQIGGRLTPPSPDIGAVQNRSALDIGQGEKVMTRRVMGIVVPGIIATRMSESLNAEREAYWRDPVVEPCS